MPVLPASHAAITRIRRLFVDEQSMTTPLLVGVFDLYGSDVLDWDPLTLRLELESDLSIRVPDWTLDKLQAGTTLLTTDQFFASFESFAAIAQTLNTGDPRFGEWPELGSTDIAWATAENMLLLGDAYDPQMFQPEVRVYAGHVLANDKIVRPPKLLAWATPPALNDQLMGELTAEELASIQTQNEEAIVEVEIYLADMYKRLFEQLKSMTIIHADSKWGESLEKLTNAILRSPHIQRPATPTTR